MLQATSDRRRVIVVVAIDSHQIRDRSLALCDVTCNTHRHVHRALPLSTHSFNLVCLMFFAEIFCFSYKVIKIDLLSFILLLNYGFINNCHEIINLHIITLNYNYSYN